MCLNVWCILVQIQNMENDKNFVSLNKEVVCMSVCSKTNISFNC